MSIRKEHIHFVILLALCGVVFFAGLGIRDIWNIDEGMHAAMAQNMLISGEWITPTYNGEAFLDKPPLFNWANAIAFIVFGITEFAARIPSAVAGSGCVILTYLLGRKIFDARTGLLAGIILATSLEMIILSRAVQYDVVFTFFTTLALYLFVSGVIEQRFNKRYFLAFYVALALAFLTKGPLAIVLTGLVIGGYLLHRNRIKLLPQLQIPLGTLIFMVIVTPWFALMEKANPGYLNYFLYQQHFANFFSGAGEYQPRHIEPFYYYLPVLLLGLLPWSLMLPQAITRAVRQHRTVSAGMSLFLIIWVIGVFLFFSSASSKLSTYVLPLFPAAALLLGRYWSEFLDKPDSRARFGILLGTGVVFAALALFTAYVVIENPWTYLQFRSGIVWHDFEMSLFLLSALFGLAFLLTWLRQNRPAFVVLAAISPLFLFYVLFAIVPDVNPYKSSRQIALELDALLPAGEKIRFYGHHHFDSAVFYTRRDTLELRTEEQLEAHLASDERRYALVQTRARTEKDAFKGNYHVIKVIGNKAIVSNRPDTQQTGN
ncbi:MAG: glycosyltransferase family 39 protein [Gammaproteobacteria bacterium]|jgi:4-amino-4-deoxy-L-arabinose transferase-like glycosyltransferase